MIRLLTAVLLFASFNAVAQTQVPNVFEDGMPASAAEVNENFDTLETAIDAVPAPPTDCSTDQIIKWNGSAWVCSDPSGAAGLTCSTDQIIKWNGSAWACADDRMLTGWWRVDSWSGADPSNLECANAFDSTSRNVKFYFPAGALVCRSTIYDFSVTGIQFYQGCSVVLEENSGSIEFRREEANSISYYTSNVAVGEPAKFVLSCPDEAVW